MTTCWTREERSEKLGEGVYTNLMPRIWVYDSRKKVLLMPFGKLFKLRSEEAECRHERMKQQIRRAM
jgi:hypothetical protein